MLTPAFDLSQDEESVTVVIYIKYGKIAESEVCFEDNDFKFYCQPYFLRLNLPGKVKSSEEESSIQKAKYDADSGKFIFRMEKQQAGEQFEGLDLITKLLAPSKPKGRTNPLIEVVDAANEDEDEEFDWQVDQEPYKELATNDIQISPTLKYGFANQYSGVFTRLQDEILDVIDIKDPDLKTFSERIQEQKQKEAQDFSEEHYLADFFEDDHMEELMQYKPQWAKVYCQLKENKDVCADDIVSFTEKEKEKMRNLPRKEYLLEKLDKRVACLGLVDIIYAYAYQHRTTEGENNVESGWTISKISSTLSWLNTYDSFQDVVVHCMRRTMCYPLYRKWSLAEQVLDDTKQLFELGRKQILKCLLEIHTIFSMMENHYILNDLYITDYCIWLQHISKKLIGSIAKELQKVAVSKRDVELDLEELESAGHLVKLEESQTGTENHLQQAAEQKVNEVCNGLKKMQLADKSIEDNDKNSQGDADNKENIITSTITEATNPNESSEDDDNDSADSADYYLDSDDVSSDSDT